MWIIVAYSLFTNCSGIAIWAKDSTKNYYSIFEFSACMYAENSLFSFSLSLHLLRSCRFLSCHFRFSAYVMWLFKWNEFRIKFKWMKKGSNFSLTRFENTFFVPFVVGKSKKLPSDSIFFSSLHSASVWQKMLRFTVRHLSVSNVL